MDPKRLFAEWAAINKLQIPSFLNGKRKKLQTSSKRKATQDKVNWNLTKSKKTNIDK